MDLFGPSLRIGRDCTRRENRKEPLPNLSGKKNIIKVISTWYIILFI